MMNNNVSFKGIKNIFCANNIPISKTQSTAYMSMQLDNNITPDLDEYKKFKALQGIKSSPEEDILTLTYIRNEAQKKEHLFLNDKELFWGDELRLLRDKYVPKSMSMERYKHEEKLHMRAYTLLAGLTRRMANMSIDTKDGGASKVIDGLFKTMYKLLEDQKIAFHLTFVACSNPIKFQPLAEAFNKAIQLTMSRFFK